MNLTKKGILTAVLIFVAALVISMIVYAAVTYVSIPSSGTILTEADLAVSPVTINWGSIPIGSTATVTRTFTLTNTGQQTTVPLTMTHTLTVGAVTWDKQGVTIAPGASVLCTVTLAPSGSAPAGPFSGSMTIGGA